jgi:nucleoside-diphosphate-sugar epimerase
MKVILFGARGMVGQGVLRECLLDSSVEHVLSINRSPSGQKNAKLTEIVHEDFFDFSAVESQLTGCDAGFYCAGPSAAGMTEDDYFHATYDVTLAAAQTLARVNPAMTFIYISGAGTFRPGIIQPLHGIQSRTSGYRIFYAVTKPLLPLLRWLLPQYVTTTELLGRAMIRVAQTGYPKRILETRDINQASLG